MYEDLGGHWSLQIRESPKNYRKGDGFIKCDTCLAKASDHAHPLTGVKLTEWWRFWYILPATASSKKMEPTTCQWDTIPQAYQDVGALCRTNVDFHRTKFYCSGCIHNHKVELKKILPSNFIPFPLMNAWNSLQYCKHFDLSSSINSWTAWIWYSQRFNFFTDFCTLKWAMYICNTSFLRLFIKDCFNTSFESFSRLTHMDTNSLVIYTSSFTKTVNEPWNHITLPLVTLWHKGDTNYKKQETFQHTIIHYYTFSCWAAQLLNHSL